MRLLDHMEHNKINPVVPKVGLSVYLNKTVYLKTLTQLVAIVLSLLADQ